MSAFLTSLKLFCRVWLHRLFPQKGWAKLVKDHKRGVVTWPCPIEGGHALVPWPLQWVPHTEAPLEETEGRGWNPASVICYVSKTEALGGVGVCCARCGVNLHQDVGLPPSAPSSAAPSCPVCRPFINLAKMSA
jgi:hypothetical protein